LKELKVSLKSKDRKEQDLEESLSKTCDRNKAFELELNAAKVKINNLGTRRENREPMDHYGITLIAYNNILEKKPGNHGHKRSIQLYGRSGPRSALDVDISSNDTETTNPLQERRAFSKNFMKHSAEVKLVHTRSKIDQAMIMWLLKEITKLQATMKY